ncbi:MAG: Holliday junction resolvase RuvX [Candidatus Dependentiae bacterium]|nr:Holliday junction resolvase RuvX [Candidatus Dependentiae bacterium]
MGKILALDPGDRWIGIAISDPLQLIARPLTTVSLQTCESFLTDLFTREKVELVLIGNPITAAGRISEQTRKVQAWKQQLEDKFPMQAFMLWDERRTSQQAEALQRITRHRHDPAKRLESHALAASFILDSYLILRQPNDAPL